MHRGGNKTRSPRSKVRDQKDLRPSADRFDKLTLPGFAQDRSERDALADKCLELLDKLIVLLDASLCKLTNDAEPAGTEFLHVLVALRFERVNEGSEFFGVSSSVITWNSSNRSDLPPVGRIESILVFVQSLVFPQVLKLPEDCGVIHQSLRLPGLKQ